MHHYIDIHLRPDPEFPAHQLMAALFAKLHRVLAQNQSTTVGVSFPGYGLSPITLGTTMRLFGPAADLAHVMAQPWLVGMRDHTTTGEIAAVPATSAHRRLQRVQAKSSPERLMRRQRRRHGLSEDAALAKFSGARARLLELPFVTVSSKSTAQSFKLFLKLGPTQSPEVGDFNTYGLGAAATVPWF